MTKMSIDAEEMNDLVRLAAEIGRADPLESDYTRTIKVGRLIERIESLEKKYAVAPRYLSKYEDHEDLPPFVDTPSFKRALDFGGYSAKVERKNARDFEDLFNELQRKNLMDIASDKENYVIEISKRPVVKGSKKNKKVKK